MFFLLRLVWKLIKLVVLGGLAYMVYEHRDVILSLIAGESISEDKKDSCPWFSFGKGKKKKKK